MDANAKLEAITAALDGGATVYLSTPLRVAKITPSVRKRWQDAGRPVVKVAGGSLYLASGRSYVCADHCRITAQK